MAASEIEEKWLDGRGKYQEGEIEKKGGGKDDSAEQSRELQDATASIGEALATRLE